MKPVAQGSPIQIKLANAQMTARVGRILAALAHPGDVIALWGDLGAGKTTLARGFIAALAPEEENVPSPTFTLVQTYPAQIDGDVVEIWHFDCYRLKSAEEAYEIGIEEAFIEGISLIEWPERLGLLLPQNRLDVTLVTDHENDSRLLNLAGSEAWLCRLSGFIEAMSGE